MTRSRLVRSVWLLGLTLTLAAPASWADDSHAAAATPPANESSPLPCFKLTLRCVNPDSSGSRSTSQPLDLSAPDIRRVIPPSELQTMLAAETDEPEPPETVRVESSPPPVVVPPGFAGMWWALKHPTQAWRLFAPVQ